MATDRSAYYEKRRRAILEHGTPEEIEAYRARKRADAARFRAKHLDRVRLEKAAYARKWRETHRHVYLTIQKRYAERRKARIAVSKAQRSKEATNVD